jgi:hypothetical protein
MISDGLGWADPWVEHIRKKECKNEEVRKERK